MTSRRQGARQLFGLLGGTIALIMGMVALWGMHQQQSVGAQGAATETPFSTPSSSSDVATMVSPWGTPMNRETPISGFWGATSTP